MSKVITFLPNKTKLIVDDGETILAAALRQNFTLKWGCDAGSCLACEAVLLSGELLDLQGEKVSPSDSAILLCQHTADSDCQIEMEDVFPENTFPVSEVYCQVVGWENNQDYELINCLLLLPAGKKIKRNEGDFLQLHIEGVNSVFKICNSEGLESRQLFIEIPKSEGQLIQQLKRDKAITISLPLS